MGKFDKKTVSRAAGKSGSREPERNPELPLQLQTNSEYRKIASWLLKVKFKPKFFGGVDPLDVWEKIEELNQMYESALMAERIRCDMVIEKVRNNAVESGWISPEDKFDV